MPHLRSSSVLLASLIACGPASTDAGPFAPPPVLTLDTPSVFVAGRTQTLTATNAPVGVRNISLVASLADPAGPVSCPPPLLGECLDIPAPARLLASERLVLGVASFQARVPNALAGQSVSVQAASFVNGTLHVSAPALVRVLGPNGDEDGDGLSNGDEILFGSDPTLIDTDGDGVFDAAEVAAGTDPAVCDLPGDTDGDGLDDCRELELGTALQLVDTDGDGFSDFREVVELGFSPQNNNFRFNPLIADTPRVEVTVTSPPAIAVLYSSSTGVELSHEVERSQTSASTVTTGNESTNSHAVEFSVGMGASLTVGSSAGFPSGVSGSVEATVSYETSLSTTSETSLSWSAEQSQENAEGFAEAEALAQSEGTTIDGGALGVTVNVQNTGDIAYTLTNLAISAYMSTPGEQTILSPVGTLSFDTTQNDFPDFSYGPGQLNGPLVFLNDGLDVGTVQSLLNDSTNLHIQVAAYEITDDEGRSFTHNETDIRARTATIIVDYEGDNTLLESERYQVATNVDPNVLRTTAVAAMTDTLRMPFTLDADGELISVRDVANDPARLGFWHVVHASSDGLVETVDLMGPTTADYDFSALELKSGDTLHLVYVLDDDFDGLGRRQEAAYGTDITLTDTDADGLSDGDEVLIHKTDPNDPDADLDGLLDGDEILFGSDPAVADTDGDGMSDGDEVAYGTDPLLIDTDDDGVLDPDEQIVGTDPLDLDTDDDCMEDGEEVWDTLSSPFVPQEHTCGGPSLDSSVLQNHTFVVDGIRLDNVSRKIMRVAVDTSFDMSFDWSLTGTPGGSGTGHHSVWFAPVNNSGQRICVAAESLGSSPSLAGSETHTFATPTTPGVYYVGIESSTTACAAASIDAAVPAEAVATIKVVTEL